MSIFGSHNYLWNLSLVGATGPVGSGVTGYTGPVGMTGPVGSGSTGPTGPVGAQGSVASGSIVTGATGSVSAPGFTFLVDTNTGMYSSANDTLDFACGGERRLALCATGTGNAIWIIKDDTGGGQQVVVKGKTNGNQQMFLGYDTGSNFSKIGSIVQGSAGKPIRLYGTDVLADVDLQGTLGGSSNRWTTIYAQNSTINTSDLNLKESITDLTLGTDFLKRLRPVSYKWKDIVVHDPMLNVDRTVTHNRKHLGLIAQEVKSVLDDLKIPTSDFAGYVDSAVTESPDQPSRLGLAYTEFIPILIKSIKELDARIRVLEGS